MTFASIAGRSGGTPFPYTNSIPGVIAYRHLVSGCMEIPSGMIFMNLRGSGSAATAHRVLVMATSSLAWRTTRSR